jgi:hypothetical protein
MEFLLYLTPVGNEIVNSLAQAKFKIRENTQICRQEKSTFGYMHHRTDEFVVCTTNIKNGGWSLKHYVNETVYHEAVHAAQNCKSRGIFSIFGPSSLGIPKKSMPMSADKLDEVKRSSSFGLGVDHKEYEAYYLESKPQKVIHYVKKFCF